MDVCYAYTAHLNLVEWMIIFADMCILFDVSNMRCLPSGFRYMTRPNRYVNNPCLYKCYNNDDDILFSLQVRCNFLDLLLRVKTLKDIHFIEVRHPPLFIQHT